MMYTINALPLIPCSELTDTANEQATPTSHSASHPSVGNIRSRYGTFGIICLLWSQTSEVSTLLLWTGPVNRITFSS